MNSLKSELIYSAASVNRHANCLDSEDERLVFATSKSIAVFDKRRGFIVKYLHCHNDQVSVVQFIRSADESQNISANQIETHNELNSMRTHWIMSASYDQTAIIWKAETDDKLYTPLYQLNGHEKAIISGHSLWISGPNNTQTLVTITSDIENVSKLWNDGKLVFTLKTDYIVITSKLATIPITSYTNVDLNILCLGGSDDNIHLFSISTNFKLIHLIDIMGHSDWIRSIDIVRPLSQPFIMLASASQDKFVRVWRIHLTDNNQSTIRKRTAPLTLSPDVNCQRPLFISAVLETVLAGHEGRVYDTKWSRILIHHDELSSSNNEKIRLLTCSGDKSIIIWESTLNKISLASKINNLSSSETPTTITDDIWQEVYRVGEAGECNLGFLGACLSLDNSNIYAYTLNGAIHSWSLSNTNEKNPSSSIEWNPVQTIGGHFGPVTDLVWQEDGHYFITSSLDKTCRAHGYIEKLNRWNEISRPQVHGYEINCLALVDNLRLASGADEKTIRLFEATTFFVKTFEKLTNINLLEKKFLSNELAAHAQVPALGLSNRAVSLLETGPNDPIYDMQVKNFNCPDELTYVPVEEILLQNTIWPEVQKLYGHSQEIYSVASDGKGTYLASACKANKSEFAIIIIWDLASFDKISTLSHHTLTVTRLKYSPNNKYLLSVSRDRTWCLWENEPSNQFSKLAFTTNQTTKHSRIIWDCSWTSDSSYFITVSRDRKAIVWAITAVISKQQDELVIEDGQYLCLEDSIQAVDTQDSFEEKKSTSGQTIKTFLVAFGLEKGHIILSRLSTVERLDQSASTFEWSICCTIDW